MIIKFAFFGAQVEMTFGVLLLFIGIFLLLIDCIYPILTSVIELIIEVLP